MSKSIQLLIAVAIFVLAPVLLWLASIGLISALLWIRTLHPVAMAVCFLLSVTVFSGIALGLTVLIMKGMASMAMRPVRLVVAGWLCIHAVLFFVGCMYSLWSELTPIDFAGGVTFVVGAMCAFSFSAGFIAATRKQGED